MKTISWFEIPTTELGRAVTFYETMLGSKLTLGTTPGPEMAFFPYTPEHTGGCLVRDPQHAPAASGTRIYFACDATAGGLDGCVERARGAGGAIVLPKTGIGEHGFIALIKDVEGNVIGLHSER